MWAVIRLLCPVIACIALWSLTVYGGKLPRSTYAKDELPHVSCQVCEKAAYALHDQLVLLKNEADKKKVRISETKIEEVLENLCDPQESVGQWIRRLDITEVKEDKKSVLWLTEPGGVSKCAKECATIAKSCELMFTDEVELDEVLFYIWEHLKQHRKGPGYKNSNILPTKHELMRFLCGDDERGSRRCGKHRPKLSYSPPLATTVKGRKNSDQQQRRQRADEVFVALSEKDLEMERLVSDMDDSGLGNGMTLLDRDAMLERLQDEYGIDGEEDFEGMGRDPYGGGGYGESDGEL